MPRFLSSFLIAILLLGGAACQKGKAGDAKDKKKDAKAEATPAVKKDKPFLTPVLTKVAERKEIRATVATTGSIVPFRSQSIRTEEAGRLQFTKPWREGDAVAEGELLAEIDSPSLQRELDLARADVKIQQESLDLAERSLKFKEEDFHNLQDLYSRGIAAKKEVDASELELERARNSREQTVIGIQKTKTALHEAELRLERLKLKAPYAGLVIAGSTLEGSGKFLRGFGSESVTSFDGRLVSAGQLVCGIADTSQVYMRCDVTSKDVGRLTPNADADATIYSTDDLKPSGKVARISGSVNPDTRAFEVDILLGNPGLTLKPGMFGRAEIVVERRRDRIVLPKSALTRRNNVDVVFVATPQADAGYDVAKMVPVELGLEGRDETEVTFGVQAGDRVVVRGHEVLQDNTPVNAVDADAPIKPEETKEPDTAPAATPKGS